jgi:hypothetical protein
MFLSKLKEKLKAFIKRKPDDFPRFNEPNEFADTMREIETPVEAKRNWLSFKIKF